MKKVQKELHEIRKRNCDARAEIRYCLIAFGDHLAQREGYKQHTGLEALQYYLIQKFHWLPAEVFALSDEHLEFLFAEETEGWTLSKEALV